MTDFKEWILSAREYEKLRKFVEDSITDDPRFPLSPVVSRQSAFKQKPSANLAAFRAATRVYLATYGSLRGIDALLSILSGRRSKANAPPRKPLVASRQRLAISLASLLFFHRFLYRLFNFLRLQLLHEKVRRIRQRWPKVYDALTSRYAPAIGSSLSGFALGVCPTDQLRVTIVIYILVRTFELLYQAADLKGFLRKKPGWIGSWMLFALGQGQLLHAFVFDRDCFPEGYGDFILKHVPEYIQQRPANLSSKVRWPGRYEIVDGLAEMARSKWPPFVSPILRPKDQNTLPKSINPVIGIITSRAHPAIHHLSCALIHPNDTSCFTPFLRQILLSFTTIGKFLGLYFGALSLLRVKKLFKEPVQFIARLVQQVLKITIVVVGSIAGSWGSICFFNNYLPKSFMPTFRFFLGGTLAGSIAIIDRSQTGHENAMYVTRTSLDSLWKVGVKHRWWRGIKGGDVLLFVASLATLNVLYDGFKTTSLGKERSMMAIKVLRGEIEIGLQDEKDQQEIKLE